MLLLLVSNHNGVVDKEVHLLIDKEVRTMELSGYDLAINKENRVNKTVPMSRELSEKINEVLQYMPNTDFSKCTREMWVRLILKMKDEGVFNRQEIIRVQSVADDYFKDHLSPFVKKNRLTNRET